MLSLIFLALFVRSSGTCCRNDASQGCRAPPQQRGPAPAPRPSAAAHGDRIPRTLTRGSVPEPAHTAVRRSGEGVLAYLRLQDSVQPLSTSWASGHQQPRSRGGCTERWFAHHGHFCWARVHRLGREKCHFSVLKPAVGVNGTSAFGFCKPLFKIHPFVDGNNLRGDLVLEAAVRGTALFLTEMLKYKSGS